MYFRELTADVSEAAAALGPGGDQSLVVSAGWNVGLTEIWTAFCNTHTHVCEGPHKHTENY